MKILISFVLILALYFSSNAQPKGYLKTSSDSIAVRLKFPKEKGEQQVYIQYSSSGTWFVIYPESADEASIPGKLKFLSQKLPDEDKKVWMNCIFEGEGKLLVYQRKIYFLKDSVLKALSTMQRADVGYPLALVQEYFEIAGKEDVLTYFPSLLNDLFVRYHKERGLDYKEYHTRNHYTTYLNLSLGTSFDKLKFANGESAGWLNGQSYFAEGGVKLASTAFPKFIKLYIGARLSRVNVSGMCQIPASDRISYYTIENSWSSLSMPLLVECNLMKKSSFVFDLAAGIEFSRAESGSFGIVREDQISGVVTTSLQTVSVAPNWGASFCNRMLVSIPSFSSKIRLGSEFRKRLSSSGAENELLSSTSLSVLLNYTF